MPHVPLQEPVQSHEDGQSPAEGLAAELAKQRALLTVCETYLRRRVEAPLSETLLRTVAERQQEIIYLLARALRLAGRVAAEVAADPGLSTQGARQRGAPARLQFLQVQVEGSLARFRSAASLGQAPGELLDGARHEAAAVQETAGSGPDAAAPSDSDAPWEELAALAQLQAETIHSA